MSLKKKSSVAETGAASEIAATTLASPRPRLARLSIANFRTIGSQPVVLELDDIVVLVGPNNAGKSSILKAYEVVMSEGAKEGELSLEDFPNAKTDAHNPPTVELSTVVFDKSPGDQWIATNEAGEMVVRERWVWSAPGKPTRRGFNVSLNRWAEDGDAEKVPWGFAGVANARRPQPHRVEAFASPEAQAAAIVKLLMKALQDRVESYSSKKGDPTSEFGQLLKSISVLQAKVLEESKQQIAAIEQALSSQIAGVFPGHVVTFDPDSDQGIEKSISLFKGTPSIKMGPADGFQTSLERQGSGARRTLLWTAIRLLAEDAQAKKGKSDRPFLLLLDEPEICLHPGAVREACRLLYELPEATGNWQVVITTHSPCFVDFGRDHTSFVRVEREKGGAVTGTTIFRPAIAKFDDDDRRLLKLLNMCDPYVAEFFFGGRTVLVEGDTEFTAFQYIISRHREEFSDVHVVRARGKATLVSLAKILNQFGAPYAILHDADRPTYTRKDGKEMANPAWAHNISILAEAKNAKSATRVVASVPNFEGAYLAKSYKHDKPYNALQELKADGKEYAAIKNLLSCLVDFAHALPDGAVEWTTEEDLEARVATAGS